MGDYVIRPLDIFDIIRRHKRIMTVGFIGAFSMVMGMYVVIPRTYRSEVVVHIGVSYFQNPLIGDLISQTHDPGELRAEREKIIKSALGTEFARKMGDTHKLFRTAPDDLARAIEIEFFLKSLDISPLTATQFTIKYKGRNPVVVDSIIRSAVDAIRETMYAGRVRMLEEFYTVLQEEIATTGAVVTPQRSMTVKDPKTVGVERLAAERVQLDAQVQVLEKRLEDLQRSYSSNHPSVQAVKTELSELRGTKNSGELSPRMTRRRVFGSASKAGGGTSNIREDLQKQEHLLSISLEMEKKDPTMSSYVTLVKEPIFPKSPVFPKIRLFLLTALIAGIMFASLGVAVAEFWLRTDVSPDKVAAALDAELFGTIILTEPKHT